MSSERTTDTQDLPIPNDEEIAHRAVARDLEERLKLGIKKYGHGLQPFNGRNSLQDAYEETLDRAVYLNCAKREMEEIRKVLREFRDSHNEVMLVKPMEYAKTKTFGDLHAIVRSQKAYLAVVELANRLLGEDKDA